MATHPVAPDLISDFPELDRKRRRVAVSSAHRAILRRRRSVTVFNPRRSFFDSRTATFDVDRDGRFGTRSARECHELVSAEVARLGFILPRQVGPGDALVARVDAPQPVIVLRDVAAGPANKRRVELFDLFENIATHTAGRSVTRQQRHLVDPNRTFSGNEDREPGERIAVQRIQGKLILSPIGLSNVIDMRFRVNLTEVYIRLERYAYAPIVIRCPEPHIASILQTCTYRNARLINSVALDHTLAGVNA